MTIFFIFSKASRKTFNVSIINAFMEVLRTSGETIDENSRRLAHGFLSFLTKFFFRDNTELQFNFVPQENDLVTKLYTGLRYERNRVVVDNEDKEAEEPLVVSIVLFFCIMCLG